MPMRLLKVLLLGVVIAAVVGTGYLVRSASSDRSNEQIARINGEPLYESDLPGEVIGEIRSLRYQEYRLKYQAIRETALRRLLEAEAKKRNVTIEELIRLDVDSKVADPTEEELKGYFESQKERLGKPLEEVMGLIRETLRKPRVDTARREYFLQMLDSAHVQILVDAPRVEVASNPDRIRGNPMAPVRIVEFSDFQCPFCRRAQPTITAILAKYGDQVSHSFRDFPLRDLHDRAQAAAEAGRCAGEQNKFWEFHKVLYANFGQLSREDLLRHAQTVGLAMPSFEACFESGKYVAAVEQDFQDGLRAGVSSTPTIFINGIPVVGAQPQATFEEIINAEIARSQQ